jgi:dihydroxyacetone kinase-like protein
MTPADQLAARMLGAIDGLTLDGKHVLVIVNGMGSTPLSELYILFGAVARLLEDQAVPVERSLVGNYVTALDMRGASLTLAALDDAQLAAWDAPVMTAALEW